MLSLMGWRHHHLEVFRVSACPPLYLYPSLHLYNLTLPKPHQRLQNPPPPSCPHQANIGNADPFNTQRNLSQSGCPNRKPPLCQEQAPAREGSTLLSLKQPFPHAEYCQANSSLTDPLFLALSLSLSHTHTIASCQLRRSTLTQLPEGPTGRGRFK